MIWRKPYETHVLPNHTFPTVDAVSLVGEAASFPQSGAVVGGFSLEALPSIEIWRRLLPDPPKLLLFDVGPRELELALPKSIHASTFVSTNSESWFTEMMHPDKDQPFAMVQADGQTPLAMVGLATEEALDAFIASLRTASKS
ncbi:MAG TPA: hypothetical protein VG944_10930 [Fimbriimonas sp.]|nr:hypothetical protein [Fimbriimonas sp.]